MKSKRAEKYIEEHRDKHPYPSGDFSAGAAFEAVDLAEEDMVDKAAKAFCAVHCPKGCPFDNREECNALREFKRKMEE